MAKESRHDEPELARDEHAMPEGLVYSSDAKPGITRFKRGDHFRYKTPAGEWIKDKSEIARINKLAIPPAYRSVWICPQAHGHIQATGLDARGRKQYRYHPRWREERDASKFERLLNFSEALPRIRARVSRDLKAESHSRELVLATIVRLLDTTLIRVGNDEYARENGSFGLTTLRNRHAKVKGATVELSFRGKSGVEHEVTVTDQRIVRVVKRCLHIPGQELFQYLDEQGTRHSVGSGDVNEYIWEAAGERFTAKDFRTWHGSVLALDTLRGACSALGGYIGVKELLGCVAKALGNTPAVCRKAYIHPNILALHKELSSQPEKAAEVLEKHCSKSAAARSLHAAEQRLVAFLCSVATDA